MSSVVSFLPKGFVLYLDALGLPEAPCLCGVARKEEARCSALQKKFGIVALGGKQMDVLPQEAKEVVFTRLSLCIIYIRATTYVVHRPLAPA